VPADCTACRDLVQDISTPWLLVLDCLIVFELERIVLHALHELKDAEMVLSGKWHKRNHCRPLHVRVVLPSIAVETGSASSERVEPLGCLEVMGLRRS